MSTSVLCKVLSGIGISLMLLTSCVKDTNLDMPATPNQSFVEEFDTLSSAISRGWRLVNTSSPKGSGLWQQGGDVVPWFTPYSNNGSNAGFVGADYTSTSAAAGDISNWLISPSLIMQNGDKVVFYTAGLQYDDGAGDSTDYGNRLQVRLNTINDGLSTGSGTTTGDFANLMLDINPTYLYSSKLTPEPNSYPSRWTRFEVTIFGLSKPTTGRFAFRYFVQGGGSNGLGSGVAVDHVTYKSAGY